MTKDTTYQGWTNYQTWALKLWIDDDPERHSYYHDYIAKMRKEKTAKDAFEKPEHGYSKAEIDIADVLQNDTEALAPLQDLEASVYSDLLNHAIAHINYREIAGALVEETEE